MRELKKPNEAFPRLINWFFCKAQLNDFPGKYRLFKWSKKKFSGRWIRYSINNQPFYVPIEEWCFWLEKGPINYYPQDVAPFIEQINKLEGDTVFIDCGADIGTVSMLVAKGSNKISHFICIEPNKNAFELLQKNKYAINENTHFINQAVSNFSGMADLHFNNDLSSDHEGHITANENGEIVVTTLDTLCESLGLMGAKNFVLKIDVEGQEQAVFEGAKKIIQNARCCVVLLEIHPDVLDREQQTAESIFSSAEQFAHFTWTLPAENNQSIDRKIEFFKQYSRQQYDVMGICLNA